jgi:hypothetical protein
MGEIDTQCRNAGIDPEALEAYRQEEEKKGHTVGYEEAIIAYHERGKHENKKGII